MGAGLDRIHEKIKTFNKKYYLNIFLRGFILSLSILFSYFLLAAVLEHNLWLGPTARLFVFVTFFAVAVICIYKFLKEPLIRKFGETFYEVLDNVAKDHYDK